MNGSPHSRLGRLGGARGRTASNADPESNEFGEVAWDAGSLVPGEDDKRYAAPD